MIAQERLAVRAPDPAAVPEVRLLEARGADADEASLRERARSEALASGGRYTSRSYRHPFALLAWHSEPVGIDIERIESADAAFAELICTPSERAEAARAGDHDAYLSSLWSSKEALSKALGDSLRYEPGQLESPMHWPVGRAGAWRAQELAAPYGHVAWLCWRAHEHS